MVSRRLARGLPTTSCRRKPDDPSPDPPSGAWIALITRLLDGNARNLPVSGVFHARAVRPGMEPIGLGIVMHDAELPIRAHTRGIA